LGHSEIERPSLALQGDTLYQEIDIKGLATHPEKVAGFPPFYRLSLAT
jgi:hypothetical protein